MNKKLLTIALFYILVILIAFFLLAGGEKKRGERQTEKQQQIIVTVNALKQNISAGNAEEALRISDEISESFSPEQNDRGLRLSVIVPLLLSVIGILTMLIYLDVKILRPFRELKEYASDIAGGNLEKPLQVRRGNYFGDFTWAFDSMRREIVKSRASEKEAIENNKTVIATLSHDIKTPVASIRAYAEAFEANMDSNAEKRRKYLSVLTEKCDEVTKLTNDLFLHSVSEMNRLEVHAEKLDIVGFINEDVRKLFVEDEAEIKLPGPSEILIHADAKRLLQIFENLKNNAEKYAKTKIRITLEQLTSAPEHEIRIHFRDFGPGIPEDEIPFITGKFYRGKNAGTENGSGLGLYIVSELLQKMDGKLLLVNTEQGLDAILCLPFLQSFK